MIMLTALCVFSCHFISSMSDYIKSGEKDEAARIAQSVADFSKNHFSGSKKALKEELGVFFDSFDTKGKIKITVYDADFICLRNNGVAQTIKFCFA